MKNWKDIVISEVYRNFGQVPVVETEYDGGLIFSFPIGDMMFDDFVLKDDSYILAASIPGEYFEFSLDSNDFDAEFARYVKDYANKVKNTANMVNS